MAGDGLSVPTVDDVLSDRVQLLLKANRRFAGELCPDCGTREVEVVDVARRGITPDPDTGVRSNVERGSLLFAHSDSVGDYCVLPPDSLDM